MQTEIEVKQVDLGKSILIVLLAILLGYAAFTYLAEPKIAVIQLSGTIDRTTTDNTVAMLRYAKDRDAVKAVVLRINSPGGSASLSEEIYMHVVSLKKEKPVVASIDQIGASGSYYAAIGSNIIYAKPTSIVGSVGVVTRLPSPEELDEDSLTSGPLKELGTTRRDWAYQAQEAAETFLKSVILERGGKLKITEEELASGGIYIGTKAWRLGLVDKIGSTEDALDAAADLAGLRRYSIVDVNEELDIKEPIAVFQVNESALETSNTAPVHYFLYLARAER
ncbi:MAG: S49 family peptidase [Candidatus Hydrothermarchaeales archaeon]